MSPQPMALALALVVLAGGVMAGTGVLALVLARAPRVAASLAAAGALVGGAVGLWAVVSVLKSGAASGFSAAWAVPGGALAVGLDPLSAFFLAPLFAIGALCAVYGRSYLGARAVPAAALNLLLASMVLVLIARHALLFLVAWEAMTLLAYLLVTLEHGDAEVRRAGWVYLVASHVGVVALFALFVIMGARAHGALDFASLALAWQAPAWGAAGLLALGLLGFGVKTGVVGLHVWLPEAHAAAPSHVSALMSAVLIKLGLYGILRTTLLVAPGAWFGAALMALGIVGALFGIALALAQRDLKRTLAYSSIENVGIVLVGLGLGFWARAHGDTRIAALGFAGGLLHVWNHAAMKALMFLGAGSVLHGAGSKDVEHLGGLLRRMRWTGRGMLLGAVAMAGLPPLNGFTGEWLLYRGLTEEGTAATSPANLAAMAGAAGLALTGGLAALCFVRLVGVVLLGTPRSDGAAHAHESPWPMTVPMAVLATACVAGALCAPSLVSAQAAVLAQLHVGQGGAGGAVAAAAHVVAPLVTVNLGLACAVGLAAVWIAGRVRQAPQAETWACGYAAPTSRMQYGGHAFSELLSKRALPRWLRMPSRTQAPVGPFPASASFASEPADPLTRTTYEPVLVRAGDWFAGLRVLQQGNLHIYLLYVFVAVMGGLAWVAVRDRLAS